MYNKKYLALLNKSKTMINHLVLYIDDYDNQNRSIYVPLLKQTFTSDGDLIEPFFNAMKAIKDNFNHEGKSFITTAWQSDDVAVRHNINVENGEYDIFENSAQQTSEKQESETYNFWDLVKGDD